MNKLTNNQVIRPKLATVAPLTNTMVNLFIWLNPIISWSILAQAPNKGLVIMDSYFLSYVWSGVFLVLAALLIYGKLTNNWDLIKFALSIGLFTKLVITYSLVVLGVQFGLKSVVGVLGLWLGITWVQFFTVRYFNLPGAKYDK